jgi:hypothetical protein
VLEFVHRTGLARAGEVPPVEALTGGVSSDIWRVDLSRSPVCVKRALPRLRVAQLWEAPVERNRYERLWAGRKRSGAGLRPDVLSWTTSRARSPCSIRPSGLEGALRPATLTGLRRKGGHRAAGIHAATAGREEVAQRLTDKTHAIRLSCTWWRRPRSIRPFATTFSSERTCRKMALVHGDVSPKNIPVAPQGPVFLDAIAWCVIPPSISPSA